MLLKEFFSVPLSIDQNQKKPNDVNQNWQDDLFWYILDHDRLHKDYFFPIAKKLKSLKECGTRQIVELFMPMVVKGCKEFYLERDMKERMSKCFPLDLREDLCQRLYDHYKDDIQKNKYVIS